MAEVDQSIGEHDVDQVENHGVNLSVNHGLDPAVNHGLDPAVDHSLDLAVDHRLDHAIDHFVDHGGDHAMDHGVDEGLEHGVDQGLDHDIDHSVVDEHKVEHAMDLEVEHGAEQNVDHVIEHNIDYAADAVPENFQAQVKQGHDGDTFAGGGEKKWPGWPGKSLFHMLVPTQKVGSIIGRRGEFIKKIVEETRARIKILDGTPGTTERALELSAHIITRINCLLFPSNCEACWSWYLPRRSLILLFLLPWMGF